MRPVERFERSDNGKQIVEEISYYPHVSILGNKFSQKNIVKINFSFEFS